MDTVSNKQNNKKLTSPACKILYYGGDRLINALNIPNYTNRTRKLRKSYDKLDSTVFGYMEEIFTKYKTKAKK